MVLAFSLVVLGLVSWHGDWVLEYGRHDGCFGLGVGLPGLMALASQGLPLLVGLPCGLSAGRGISFVFPLCIGAFSPLVSSMPGGC